MTKTGTHGSRQEHRQVRTLASAAGFKRPVSREKFKFASRLKCSHFGDALSRAKGVNAKGVNKGEQ